MSGGTRRPTIRRNPAEGRAHALPVLLVVAALVAGCGSVGPNPSATGTTLPSASTGTVPASTAPSSSGTPGWVPGESPGITPLPSAVTNPAGWTRLDLPPMAEVASLTATRSGAGTVAPSTGFRLTSLGSASAAALAARLVASPAVSLRLVKVSGRTALLQPAAPLDEGQRYRFELRRTDGTVEAAWAVDAASPLRIASMIPDDQATGVPRNTGIEIAFDQPGVRLADVQGHFTIRPKVAGRFEQHGSTFVFVPSQPLARRTVYTVTVGKGIPVRATGMTLEEPQVIRFETAGGTVPEVQVTMGHSLFDAATDELPTLTVRLGAEDDEELATVRTLAVKVARLPGLSAAVDAWRRIDAAPDWTVRSSTTPVGTSSLRTVLSGTVRVHLSGNDGWAGWFQLPARLPAGWYVVTTTHAGISRQAVLQVTDLAVASLVTDTRTLAWVNDLRTNAPVGGATVQVAGRTLGTTDKRGLVNARTPSALRSQLEHDAAPVALVRSGGRAAFAIVETSDSCDYCGDEANDTWWQLLTFDRVQYRSTDTINAWGMLRNRDTGAVPASVTVRLIGQVGDEADSAAIATVKAAPDAAGAFLVPLRFTDLPPGDYQVEVLVKSEVVASTWLGVGPIVKPSWHIDLTVPHRAVLTGAPVEASAVAGFFEGTPVAGADLLLSVGGYEDEDGNTHGEHETVLTTDIDGRVAGSLPVVAKPGDGQLALRTVSIRGHEPEEADTESSTEVYVFPASAVLGLDATVAGSRLTVSGTVNDVAFNRFDGVTGELSDIDPAGAPRAGATIRITLTEHIPVTRQTGTRYDFIAKRTMPVYEVSDRTVQLGTRTATSGADGRFLIELPVHGGDRWYDATATYADEAGRTTSADATADGTVSYEDTPTPGLENLDATKDSDDPWGGSYGVGDTVRVRFVDGIEKPQVERYLFAVMARGLRTVSIGEGATFTTTFEASLVPAATIAGIRFTGTGYEMAANDYLARLRTEDRELSIRMTTDQARYAPGGRVTVGIETLDPAGRPVAASIFVRAVDEKLYAIEAAELDDPLEELYADTSSGLLATAHSHGSAEVPSDGKDTMGGDGDEPRSDFRDWILARLVRTGADGRASFSFDLSDDLTSWHLVASGVTAGLLVGQGEMLVPVGLPFFAEAVLAPEYLAADHPVVRLRAYGTGLRTGDPVTFKVSSDTLPMPATTVTSTAFRPVEVALPTLSVGSHRLRIEASSGSGGSDALVRTFRVVETRATRIHTASTSLVPGTKVAGGTGSTTVTLVDAGRGRVVPLLQDLATSEPFRADAAIAAAVARGVLVTEFGFADGPGLPAPEIWAYQPGNGVSLLPYASADLELSAIAALSGAAQLDQDTLSQYFYEVLDEEDGPHPIERVLYKLLGEAATGSASIADVSAAAARKNLTPAQRVTVALAALAVGDEPLARSIYRDLLAHYGQRQGPWVRVKTGDADQTAIATARLAIVAAALGDPLAAAMDAEVAAHPPVDTLVSLERAIAAAYWARRSPKVPAVAAVTLDGRRTEVALAGGSVTYELTPAQRASFQADPVSGSVLVLSRWDGPVAAGDLTTPSGQRVTRTVTPSGDIDPVRTVTVTFSVTLGSEVGDDCWRLTDLVPSGLAPVASTGRSDETDDEGDAASGARAISPWRVEGQRVDFCVTRDPVYPTQTLRYLARVVTPGTYRWEPTVLQSVLVPEEGVVLPAFSVTIKGLGQ